MFEAAQRILEENFNKAEHMLNFSDPVLMIKVVENEVYEGDFVIYGPQDSFCEGKIFDMGLRMHCHIKEFSGSEVTVPFSFDATGLKEKDIRKGEFRIISNQGEYLLPYEVEVVSTFLKSSLGDIRNIFHFTNLARSNWEETVELFKSGTLFELFQGSDRQYIGAYYALSKSSDPQQGLEEFLLYIKKKQLAEFIVEEPNIRIDSTPGVVGRSVHIRRNGWGYSDFELSVSDDFIHLDKKCIKREDFDGNVATLSFSIDSALLHEGKNYGCIYMKNAYNDIKIQVTAHKNPLNRRLSEIERAKKHHIMDLMRYYEALKCRNISASSWLEPTTRIVDELRNLDPDNKLYELFHVQLLVTNERTNEARWVMEQLEDYVEESEDYLLYSYYYYLSTLIDRSDEYIKKVTEAVSHIYMDHSDDWRLVWLMLYLDENYAKNPKARLERIREQFERGANSPVLYVEAVWVFINNPTILEKLELFEIQILKYMVKKKLMTADITEKIISLLDHDKSSDERILPLLFKCYELYPSDELLKKMVSMLINLDKRSEKAFEYYSLAVEKSLRITRLYEYYMLSLNLEASIELPKTVLMYFAFDSSLDELHNAYLYSYIYQNKGSMPELYESYKEAIERFTSFALLSGKSNRYLASLYKKMITPGMITEDVAKGLYKVLFTQMLCPKRKNIEKVYITYENYSGEYTFYPSVDGNFYIPIYSNSFRLILEDENNNCYLRDEEYTLKELMLPDKLSPSLPLYLNESFFSLWLCERVRDFSQISDREAACFFELSKDLSVTCEFRKKIRTALYQYYYERDLLEELDSLFELITVEDVETERIPDVILLLSHRGFVDKAYEWLCIFDGEGVDPKTIVRICAKIYEGKNEESLKEDRRLQSLIFRAFLQGKSDSGLMDYMLENTEATTKELRDIWKVALGMGKDTLALEERIIEQILYTNAYVPGINSIFLSLSKRRVNSKLCMAYLAQLSYDYFVKEKLIDDKYIEEILSYIEDKEEIPMVCKLAFTHYYSKRLRGLEEKISRIIVSYLKEILHEGMHFGYFRDYSRSVTYMHRFADKTTVEYRSKEGVEVTIHYMLEKKGSVRDEYVSESMKDMYHGIHVKQFVLFFGERIQYYIVEHDGENEQLTESGTLTANDMDEHETSSRFSLINDIAIARALGDDSTMSNLLESYFQDEYLKERLFSISE